MTHSDLLPECYGVSHLVCQGPLAKIMGRNMAGLGDSWARNAALQLHRRALQADAL
jgi:hypothetical protein